MVSTLYAGDNNNYLPDGKNGDPYHLTTDWVEYVNVPEFQPSPRGIFLCPSAGMIPGVTSYRTSYTPTSLSSGWFPDTPEYGGWNYMGTPTRSRRFDRILSGTILMYPCNLFQVPWAPYATARVSAYAENMLPGETSSPSYNHSGADNFLFLEGNLKSYKAPLKASNLAGQYWRPK